MLNEHKRRRSFAGIPRRHTSHKEGTFDKRTELRQKVPSPENFTDKKPIYAAEIQSTRQSAIHSFRCANESEPVPNPDASEPSKNQRIEYSVSAERSRPSTSRSLHPRGFRHENRGRAFSASVECSRQSIARSSPYGYGKKSGSWAFRASVERSRQPYRPGINHVLVIRFLELRASRSGFLRAISTRLLTKHELRVRPSATRRN